jgi:hypothetical protein
MRDFDGNDGDDERSRGVGSSPHGEQPMVERTARQSGDGGDLCRETTGRTDYVPRRFPWAFDAAMAGSQVDQSELVEPCDVHVDLRLQRIGQTPPPLAAGGELGGCAPLDPVLAQESSQFCSCLRRREDKSAVIFRELELDTPRRS